MPDRQAVCKSCGEPVDWVITDAGKRAPMNLDGVPHFATCPQANEWRRSRKENT
ncbi:MAG: hypothetical protein ACSLE9_07870 [Burkholderiaceae bacterium]